MAEEPDNTGSEQGAQQAFVQRDPSILLLMEDLSRYFEETLHLIQGETKVYNSQLADYEWKTFGEPMMNNIGIAWFIDQLRGIANQNTIMGNLTGGEAEKLALQYANTINDGLYVNRKKFDLEIGYYDTLFSRALVFTLIALKRSVGGIERRDLIGAHRSVEQRYIESHKKEGGGLFGFFRK